MGDRARWVIGRDGRSGEIGRDRVDVSLGEMHTCRERIQPSPGLSSGPWSDCTRRIVVLNCVRRRGRGRSRMPVAAAFTPSLVAAALVDESTCSPCSMVASSASVASCTVSTCSSARLFPLSSASVGRSSMAFGSAGRPAAGVVSMPHSLVPRRIRKKPSSPQAADQLLATSQ